MTNLKLKVIKNDPTKRTIKDTLNDEEIKKLGEKINGIIEIVDYYIQRQFKRFIQIDRNILDNDVSKKFIIVNTEKDFEEKCQKQPDKSIHFLKQETANKNLIWIKSKGSISDLNKYIVNEEDFCLSIDENLILNQNENILIISADPGMGKSTILDKLILSSNLELLFIKIILKNFTEALEEIKENRQILGEKNFILNFISSKIDKIEISILDKLAKENKLILMFDGVDEVSDYMDEVKILIKTLNEKYQGNKIVITTRKSLKDELENYFETISFDLNYFTTHNQVNFLMRYWRSFKNINLDEVTLKDSAEKLIENMNKSLTDKISKLIGIPLQTKMIADIYLEKLNLEDIDLAPIYIKNISDLYHEFVEKKFKIKLVEKKGINPRLNRKIYEREKERFYEQHIELALTVLCNKTIIDKLDEEEIVEYGLIVDFRNKIPVFLHQSYAEYFLAIGTLTKMQKRTNSDDEFFNQIFIQNEFFLVRKFLNDLLSKEEIKFTLVSFEKNIKELEKINNCCKENLPYILNYLFYTENADIKSKNEFLLLASINGHKEVVRLLIEKGIDINQTNNDGRNAFHWASVSGDKAIVQLLIEKGIDIHRTDEYGDNALNLTSDEGNLEMVKLLIEKGIDINQTNNQGQNALHLASNRASKGHTEIVELLIEKGININQTDRDGNNALHWASRKGHKEIVQLLIEKGINLNQIDEGGENALHMSLRKGHLEIVQLLIEKGIDINQTNKYGENALNWASFNGHKEIVQLLMENGIDTNLTDKFGRNALHLASGGGQKEIVQLLIEKEIDIHKTDENGENSLHFASGGGNEEIVQLLIEIGIDINQTNENGNNALHLASRYGHKEIVELLIKKGIDINQINKDGENALNWASFYGHKDIVQLLIEKGIDINIEDSNGENAFHLAFRKGFTEIVELLKEKGININQINQPK